MTLKTLRVERRKDGTLGIRLELSTNPNELQENSRLLKNGGPAPALEAISAEAGSYVDSIRTNLDLGDPALEGLPQKVTFRDELRPHITDSDVEEALSRVLRPGKPSNAFARKVFRAVSERVEAQKERVQTVKNRMLEPPESPLKRMRKDRKVRQADVANLAGVSQGHLSEVETGIAMPNPKLSRLLEALDLLEPQKCFIDIMRSRTRRKLHHQLIVKAGGDGHELRET